MASTFGLKKPSRAWVVREVGSYLLDFLSSYGRVSYGRPRGDADCRAVTNRLVGLVGLHVLRGRPIWWYELHFRCE